MDNSRETLSPKQAFDNNGAGRKIRYYAKSVKKGASIKDVHFLGGTGLAAMRTKVDSGREGAKLKVDIFFSAVSLSEESAFKGDFIIIFLR